MKNHHFLIFLLLAFFVAGCEDSADNQARLEKPQKQLTAAKKTPQQTKKPVVLKKAAKRPKAVTKMKSSQAEMQDETEQKVLDLSLPTEFQQTRIVDKSSNTNQPAYLPDLFADKNNKKANTVQIDGKLMAREEGEREKQRIVDGVGVGIRLTP